MDMLPRQPSFTPHRRHAEPHTDHEEDDHSNNKTLAKTAATTSSNSNLALAPGVLSHAREALQSAAEGAGSRRSRNEQEPRHKRGWKVQRPGLVTGRFKGARAYRSFCTAGVPWASVFYRETREARSGKMPEALYPRKDGVSVETANRLLESVTDLGVEVHFDDSARQQPPRSVKWADLADTDVEDEDCAGTTAGRKGLLGVAPESQFGPRASLAASVKTGRADVRLGSASQVLGWREGLASATPSLG